MKEEKYIVIAKVGKAHGLRGEFILHPFCDDPGDLSHFSCFYKKVNDQFIPLADFYFELGATNIIAWMESVTDRESAKALTHTDIYALKSELPELEEDEYYFTDLIGCRCLYNNQEIGNVYDVKNFGAHDIFEIQSPNGKITNIPFLNDLIIEINVKDKLIRFKNLDGYL